MGLSAVSKALFALCATSSIYLASPDPAPSQAGVATAPQNTTQVFVIGTVHAPAGLLLDSSYSAAHIRAALEAFLPTAVGIEAPPFWNAWGVSFEATWEIDHVVVPWARERSVPVFGVDWAPVEGLASRAQGRFRSFSESLSSGPRLLADLREGARQRAEGVLASRFDEFADPGGLHSHELFDWINSGARNQAAPVRVWWDTRGSNDPGSDPEAAARSVDFIRARHDRVVHQIRTVTDRLRSGRIAILMGYSHKPDLDQKLAELPGVQVIQVGDLKGFTPNAVTAAWRPEDALATLREGLDGAAFYLFPEAVDQPLMTRTLQAYESAGSVTYEGRYYRARLAAVAGDTGGALRVLGDLLHEVDGEPRTAITYLEVPRLEQRIRLEMGRLYDLDGDRGSALRQYREVLRTVTEAVETVPEGASFESTTDWATAGYAAGQHLTRVRAFRETVLALIEQPWSSVYRPRE